MRIQFYPSPALEKRLEADALKLKTTTSALVNDLLNKHYGLVPPNALTDIEIERKVFEELVKFVQAAPKDEFDLNKASDTYRTIEMTYAGKPRILKARLGKKFAAMVGSGDFRNVEQVREKKNGHIHIKRTVGNRAALYRIKAADDTADE